MNEGLLMAPKKTPCGLLGGHRAPLRKPVLIKHILNVKSTPTPLFLRRKTCYGNACNSEMCNCLHVSGHVPPPGSRETRREDPPLSVLMILLCESNRFYSTSVMWLWHFPNFSPLVTSTYSNQCMLVLHACRR